MLRIWAAMPSSTVAIRVALQKGTQARAGHHRPAFTPATTRPAIPRAPPRVMFRSVVALCGCQSRGLAPVIFLDREGAGLLSDRNSPLFTIPIRRVMGTLLVPEDDPIIGGACAR